MTSCKFKFFSLTYCTNELDAISNFYNGLSYPETYNICSKQISVPFSQQIQTQTLNCAEYTVREVIWYELICIPSLSEL